MLSAEPERLVECSSALDDELRAERSRVHQPPRRSEDYLLLGADDEMGNYDREREGLQPSPGASFGATAERCDGDGVDLVQVRAGHHTGKLQFNGGKRGDGDDGELPAV